MGKETNTKTVLEEDEKAKVMAVLRLSPSDNHWDGD